VVNGLNTAFLRWPDVFVLLKLEADGEAVSDDGFGELAAGEGGVIGGDRFENVALLVGSEWVNPRKKHFALAMDFLELSFGPVVIFAGADDAFDFVGGAEVCEIALEVPFVLAAAGAFQVDDAMDAGIDGGDVVRAAGFEEHGEAGVAEGGHQRGGFFLQERLAAGEFHERRLGVAFGLGGDLVLDGGERHCFAAGEGVSGVAVGAAKVAAGEPHEDTRPPGESAFALEAEINFMDAQCAAHGGVIAADVSSAKISIGGWHRAS